MSELPMNNVEVIREALAVLALGTPGEYEIGRSGTETHEAALAWFEKAIERHESRDFYVITVTREGDIPKCVAITGNGPDGEANARALAIARVVAPAALNMLAEVWRTVEAALHQLDYGEASDLIDDPSGDVNKNAVRDLRSVRRMLRELVGREEL